MWAVWYQMLFLALVLAWLCGAPGWTAQETSTEGTGDAVGDFFRLHGHSIQKRLLLCSRASRVEGRIGRGEGGADEGEVGVDRKAGGMRGVSGSYNRQIRSQLQHLVSLLPSLYRPGAGGGGDRKSTRLNSSHLA